MSGGSKRSNIFKQTYSQKLLSILIMHDLLLPPGMRILKGVTVMEKSYCEFLILALFKDTLINSNKCRFTVIKIGHSRKSPNRFLFPKNRIEDFEKSCVTC